MPGAGVFYRERQYTLRAVPRARGSTRNSVLDRRRQCFRIVYYFVVVLPDAVLFTSLVCLFLNIMRKKACAKRPAPAFALVHMDVVLLVCFGS